MSSPWPFPLTEGVITSISYLAIVRESVHAFAGRRRREEHTHTHTHTREREREREREVSV